MGWTAGEVDFERGLTEAESREGLFSDEVESEAGGGASVVLEVVDDVEEAVDFEGGAVVVEVAATIASLLSTLGTSNSGGGVLEQCRLSTLGPRGECRGPYLWCRVHTGDEPRS